MFTDKHINIFFLILFFLLYVQNMPKYFYLLQNVLQVKMKREPLLCGSIASEN